ncbi:MAG: radical SAM protein [Spirochaetales bacterium]|nr:radical SAM protein [Spirochaetales bacterium]MCF7937406.1 radical SAM protein [Spirochaetales bacterium]
MQCNLECCGCYSRRHETQDEIPPEEVLRVVSELSRLGTFLFVVTGGEPLLFPSLFELFEMRRDRIFIVITNGTLVTDDIAQRFASVPHVFPVVSIEGNLDLTDARRGRGVYEAVTAAMEAFRSAGVIFGFSAVVSRESVHYLCRDEFFDEMFRRGCSIGFFNDFIPACGADESMVADNASLSSFADFLNEQRRRLPMLLVHLPEDEYDDHGRCTAVGSGSFHLTSQGLVEPCPFAHYASDSVCGRSVMEVIRSPFLRALREDPDALIKTGYGCSLAGNKEILQKIAEQYHARPTGRSTGRSPVEP